MKTYQNALLAGVAALALVAGTGLASAPEQPKQQAKTPNAEQQAHAPAQAQRREKNKTGMTAQTEKQDLKPNATDQRRSNAQPQPNNQNAQNAKPNNATNNSNQAANPNAANK